MQCECDWCSKEINTKNGNSFFSNRGFKFCSRNCEYLFGDKLWEKAQADKQAERKTESAAPEASGD